jgi:hypothetical protein
MSTQMDSEAVLKEKTYACQLYLPVRVTDYKLKQTSFHWIKLANTNDDKIWSFYHQRVCSNYNESNC